MNIQNRDAFSLFLSGLQEMNFKVMLNIPETPDWYELSTDHKQINEHFKGRITVNAKISRKGKEKALRFVSCLSPAAAKRGSVRANPCVQLFARQQNIPLKLAPKELLRSTLQHLTFSGSGRLAQLDDDKFSN